VTFISHGINAGIGIEVKVGANVFVAFGGKVVFVYRGEIVDNSEFGKSVISFNEIFVGTTETGTHAIKIKVIENKTKFFNMRYIIYFTATS